MVNKLKAILKLEDTLPAFLFAILHACIPRLVFIEIYQRFFHYIDVSTQDIDLPTILSNLLILNTPSLK